MVIGNLRDACSRMGGWPIMPARLCLMRHGRFPLSISNTPQITEGCEMDFPILLSSFQKERKPKNEPVFQR